MNLIEAKVILNHYLDKDIPAFLWGAPGLGKSDLVAEIAQERGIALVDIRATLLDPVDLRGLPHVINGVSHWARPNFFPDRERDGERGILFFDELNQGMASVQSACFQIVLNRKSGDYDLPSGWMIVAAGNRQTDRSAAQRMPSALANRFAHIDIDPDMKAWQEWANVHGISPMVRAFLQFRENLLHKMDGGDLRAFPSPRAWAQVAKIAELGDAVRQRLVTGLVGEGAGAEFEGFIQMWKTLPPMAEIIRNPTGASIPHEPATRYAVSTGLSRLADRNNFANILIYAARLPKEFEISIATEAVKRDKTLTQTTAYVNWAKRNQDVTL